MPEQLAVTWSVREPPLAPEAVAAIGPTAMRLASRLLAADDAALAALEGVAGPGLLVVRGAAGQLPWADGVVYCGRAAPQLFVPTTLRPSVHAELVERSLLRTFEQLPPPLLVLPEQMRVLSLRAARPIDRAALQAWLSR